MDSKVNRREFLKSLTAGSLAVFGAAFSSDCNVESILEKKPAAQKPNFVFIFADDLGWGDLGCYGNSRVRTPYLDNLAKEGTLFTQFYVCGPVCSPSRAEIMTGHFPGRDKVHGHFAGHEDNEKRGMPDFLDPKVMTVTRLLQQNGYVTGHFGKWHLGHTKDAPSPGLYGIDEFATNVSNDPNAGIVQKLYLPEYRPVATKIVLERTLEFIKKHKDQQFFVNAWLMDPHATLNPSKEQMDVYENDWWSHPPGVNHRGAWEIYYGTITEMDKQIGLFLEQLDKLGLSKNTIVIFSSDNGPECLDVGNAAHSGVGSAGPFRGQKRSIYEGGVRVPFIVRWPGKTPAARVDNSIV